MANPDKARRLSIERECCRFGGAVLGAREKVGDSGTWQRFEGVSEAYVSCMVSSIACRKLRAFAKSRLMDAGEAIVAARRLQRYNSPGGWALPRRNPLVQSYKSRGVSECAM